MYMLTVTAPGIGFLGRGRNRGVDSKMKMDTKYRYHKHFKKWYRQGVFTIETVVGAVSGRRE
jgi:hypothetical protein